MKILVSAYACEPNSGSEPFLGWRWVTEIAKHHKVTVITRDNNKDKINKYVEDEGNANDIQFVYVGLPKKLTFWKKGRRGLKLFYMLWQRKATKVAIALNRKEKFDLVHHITFGAVTQPCYMYKLGIPFIWGPLGGGEKMPVIKGRKLDLTSKIYEFVRNLQISILKYLPYARACMEQAKSIIVTTEETKLCILPKYRDKVVIMQSLGIDEEFMRGNVIPKEDNKIKILMVGRMIGWKGFDIGIDAFKNLLLKHNNIELHLRGNGELKSSLKNKCGDLLGKKIFFCEDFLDYQDMYGFYSKHDIFLNCTLHDSGCLALLEAMSAGLPVVCVNVGGPKVLTQPQYALKISTKEYNQMVEDISTSLDVLISDKKLRLEMGKRAKEKVEKDFMYDKKYLVLEGLYNQVIR